MEQTEKRTSFTIPGVLESEKNRFFTLRGEATPGASANFLKTLLDNFENKPINPNESSESIEELKLEISKQLKIIEELTDQATESAKNLSEYQNQIKPPSFIYNTPPETFKNMRRLFALLRKRGKLKTEDVATAIQQTTTTAINYYIKQEFPEVLL